MRNAVLVDDAFGPSIESPGDKWVEKAWEARTAATRVKHARKALSIDADCIDAYVLLSHDAATEAEAIALLREAVRVGDRLFAPVLDHPDMHWWGFIGTRPYMRAMHELGLALERARDLADAEEAYRRLLDLNPNDNQGVRMLLLRLLLDQGKLKECKPILDRYEDDWSLEIMLTNLMLELDKGTKRAPRKLRAEITKRNEHVLPMLAEALRYDSPFAEPESAFVSLGSEDEARSYVANFLEGWRAKKGLPGKLWDLLAEDAG